MRLFKGISLAITFIIFITNNVFAKPTQFGDTFTSGDEVPLKKVTTSPQDFVKADIITKGEVIQVCQKKGCWMMLRKGSDSIRVTFSNYSFFVPKDLSGKQVRVKGRTVKKNLTKKEVAHYLVDAGMKQENADKIAKPEVRYNFVASGVQISSQQLQ